MFEEEEDISLRIDDDCDSPYSIDFRGTLESVHNRGDKSSTCYSTRSMLSIGTNREVFTESTTFQLSSSTLTGKFRVHDNGRQVVDDDDTEKDANEILAHGNAEMSEYESTEYDTDSDSCDTDSESVTNDRIDNVTTPNSPDTQTVVITNSRGPIVAISKLDFSNLKGVEKAVRKGDDKKTTTTTITTENAKTPASKTATTTFVKKDRTSQRVSSGSSLQTMFQLKNVEVSQSSNDSSGSPRPAAADAQLSTSHFSLTPKRKGLYSSYKSSSYSTPDAPWMQRAITPRLNVVTSPDTPRAHKVDSIELEKAPSPISPRIVIPIQNATRRGRGTSMPARMDPNSFSYPVRRQISSSTTTSSTTDPSLGMSLDDARSWSSQSIQSQMDEITTSDVRSMHHLSKTLTDLIRDNSVVNTVAACEEEELENQKSSTDASSADADALSMGDISDNSDVPIPITKSVIEGVELAAHYLSAASKQISNDRITLNEERQKSEKLEQYITYYQKENEKYERLKQLYTRQSIEKESVERKMSQMKQQLQVTVDAQKRMEIQLREMQIEMSQIALDLKECKYELDSRGKTSCCCVQ